MSLWESFKHWLKWLVAEEEMLELERRRTIVQQYWRWNAEFHEVDHVLTMMEKEINLKHGCAIWEERTRDELREYRRTGKRVCEGCKT